MISYAIVGCRLAHAVVAIEFLEPERIEVGNLLDRDIHGDDLMKGQARSGTSVWPVKAHDNVSNSCLDEETGNALVFFRRHEAPSSYPCERCSGSCRRSTSGT